MDDDALVENYDNIDSISDSIILGQWLKRTPLDRL